MKNAFYAVGGERRPTEVLVPQQQERLFTPHWQEIDRRIYACIGIWISQWWPPQRDAITEAVGVVFGEEGHNQREVIAKIKDRVLALETSNSFERSALKSPTST